MNLPHASATRDDSDRLSARNQLIEAHLDWVRMIARSVYLRVRVTTVDWSDYVQAATVGMIEAANRYDPKRGVEFRAFALRRVRGAIFNSLRDLLRAASHQQAFDVLHERASSIDEPDLEPFERLICLVAGLGTGNLLEAHSMPLDPTAYCPGYGAVEEAQRRQRIERSIDFLPPRERMVVRMHYLQHVPFVEIARSMGITKGRVSQLHSAAMKRLRHYLGGSDTARREL